jgi:hypothetical protein
MALNIDQHKPFPGFGNLILYCSQYYRWCLLNDMKPVIYTTTPEKVVGIKKELFEFTSKKPDKTVDIGCDLQALFNINTQGYMHKIADLPDVELPKDIKAGFSFRFGDSKFDDKYTFMEEKCTETMCKIMNQFGKVFVCSNKNSFIQTLIDKFGENKIFTVNDLGHADDRFVASHLKQWVGLSKCPIVFHQVKTISGPDSEITTTFAPTAAVYGGSEVIGVDNNGDVFQGQNYHW